jgi:hypothetical protein
LFFIGYRRQITGADLRIIDSSLSASELEPKFERLLQTKKCEG